MTAQIGLILFLLIAPGAAALMGWLHYAIPKWIGHDIEPPATYIWGVGGGILAPYAIWLLTYRIVVESVINTHWALAGLVGICICSGTAVLFCYDQDHKRELTNKAAKAERMLDHDRPE